MSAGAGRRERRGGSIRSLIFAGAAITTFGIAVVAVGLIAIADHVRDTLGREARRLFTEQSVADEIHRQVARQLLDAAVYLNQPSDETLDRFRRRGERIYVAERSYLARPLSAAERLQVEQVKELHEALEVQAQAAFDERRYGNPDAARARAAELFAGAEPLGTALDRFLALRAADYEAAHARQERLLLWLYVAAAALGILMIVALSLGGRVIARRLLRPLEELSRAADELGAGDLTVRLPVRNDDELSRVASRFNAMASAFEALQGELRQSEARYRHLVELSPDAIVVHCDGRLVYANEAAVRWIGAPSAEALCGRSVFALVDRDSRAEAVGRLRDSLAKGVPSGAAELILRRDDGTAVRGEVAAARIDYGGRPATLVVVRDVTARREAAEALQQAERRLQQAQKMEAVGRLAGGVAHDFNNLLTVITSYTDLLAADLAKGSEREDVREIRAAAARATALTRQLLAFSRKQVLRPEVVDLNEIVAGTAGMLSRLIPEDIDVRTELAGDLALVEADPRQLEQVILNLAVNARYARPDGGRLVIRTAPERDATDDVPRVALSMSDDGCGMDRDTQLRIFEPFYTTKPPGQGTGLGLATVYGIVQQSGGYLRVESNPGRGSTFTVVLPALDRPARAVSSPMPITDAPRGSELVLLVEDEASVRALARRVLEKRGYTVIEARDGTEALAIAARRGDEVALLLTAVVMPGMGGRELATALTRARPRIKVLFTSGHTEDEVLRRGISAQAQAFLPKPFSPRELATRVREVLDA